MVSFSEIAGETIDYKLNWPQIPNYPFNALDIACIIGKDKQSFEAFSQL